MMTDVYRSTMVLKEHGEKGKKIKRKRYKSTTMVAKIAQGRRKEKKEKGYSERMELAPLK